MSSRLKPFLADWRDAARDSDLGATAKLVALTLSTYMNATGVAWPSQDLLARGASLTDTTVRKATRQIERAGFLEVEWSKGGGSHHYRAVLPSTPNEVRRSEELATVNPERGSPFNPEPHVANPEPHVANPEPPSDESVESVESEDLAPAAQARDLVWDELEQRFGAVAEKTNAHAKRNKAVADLKRHGATVDTIRRALIAWPRVFPGATVTDQALATHWPQLTAQFTAVPSARPVEAVVDLPELTDDERKQNLERMRQLAAGIGR